MGFRYSGDAFAGVATVIADGATALGTLSVAGDLTMGAGAQFFYDDGAAGAPAMARRDGPTSGIYQNGASVQIAVASAAKLGVSSSQITSQVDILCDARFSSRSSTGLVASTTQTQAAATAIPANVNQAVFATVTNANDAGKLPTAVANVFVEVINDGAQVLQLFPASGDNLGAGVDASTTIPAGSRKCFFAKDTTNWEDVS